MHSLDNLARSCKFTSAILALASSSVKLSSFPFSFSSMCVVVWFGQVGEEDTPLSTAGFSEKTKKTARKFLTNHVLKGIWLLWCYECQEGQ